MLGYIKNKSNIYHIDSIDRQLQDAVSFSGGNQQHFNLFKNLLQYSMWNKTSNIPLHDTKAGQTLLFLYPLRIQVFLSLILYRQELLIRDSFIDDNDIEVNIVRPETVLAYNSIVTRNYLSSEVINLFNNINEEIILEDDYISNITRYFSIDKSINSLDTDMRQSILNLFSIFSIRNENNEAFITLSLDNNRVVAADTLAKYLNYKQRSRSMLSQLVNQWQHQTLNT